MKTARMIILAVFTLTFLNTPLSADEKKAPETLEFKKSGFQLGGELSGVIGFGGIHFGEEQGTSGHGKIDIILGYQFNPFFSLNADLWAIDLVNIGVEINPRINFTEGRISPFLTASLGIASNLFCEDSNCSPPITYSAGVGTDIHLGKKGVVFIETKYRGFSREVEGESASLFTRGLEFGAGFRWMF